MTIQLIFGHDDKDCHKDIIFFTAAPCMDLPVVHFSLDAALMPACSYLLAVCHWRLQVAWPRHRDHHLYRPYPQVQAGRDSRIWSGSEIYLQTVQSGKEPVSLCTQVQQA